MHDVLLVKILQSSRHLRNVLRSLPLGEPVLLAQMLVQFTLASEFQNQEDSLAVVEMTIQAKHIGVAQVTLDLDFAANLLLHAALLQLGFVQDLQGTDEAG